MTIATPKQIDYINSMIDSIESAPFFTDLETKMEALQGSEDVQSQMKYQMYEGQVMQWHADLLSIRLRRNPITLVELKATTAAAIATLRNKVAGEITTVEASQMIDSLKNKKLV